MAGELGPTPTSTVVVNQSPKSAWTATVWSVEQNDQDWKLVDKPVIDRWQNDESWSLTLPSSAGALRVRREGKMIGVTLKGKYESSLLMTGGVGTSDAKDKLQAAYTTAHAIYGDRYRDLSYYRAKVTKILLLLLVLQELFFLAYRRLYGHYYATLRGISISGWLVVGFWLPLAYFRT
jgi:hypothetical protein